VLSATGDRVIESEIVRIVALVKIVAGVWYLGHRSQGLMIERVDLLVSVEDEYPLLRCVVE
jgi:hypothetical protein